MDSEFGLGNHNLFEYYEQAERVDMRKVSGANWSLVKLTTNSIH